MLRQVAKRQQPLLLAQLRTSLGLRGFASSEEPVRTPRCCHRPAVDAPGAPLPMLLSMRGGAIDRGACIKDFSQYPAEVRPAR